LLNRDPNRKLTPVGKFKFLFVRENRPDLVPIRKINNFLSTIAHPKEYKVRVYILRGL